MPSIWNVRGAATRERFLAMENNKTIIMYYLYIVTHKIYDIN